MNIAENKFFCAKSSLSISPYYNSILHLIKKYDNLAKYSFFKKQPKNLLSRTVASIKNSTKHKYMAIFYLKSFNFGNYKRLQYK